MSEDSEGYLVVVKPSARKVSATVGEWVNGHGTARRFDSKALAREWARECAGPARAVWIQDTVPWDDGQADGYLVGARRRAEARESHRSDQARLVDATPRRGDED